jgi:uncharacterized protein
MENLSALLAAELRIKPSQAAATLELLDSGNTVPFVARYRKEVTGSLDEEQIRTIEERAKYLRNLDARRQEILASIKEQEKLTPELEQKLNAATKMQELEDLYLPYKPKKRTRAMIAREKGLASLADLILAQEEPALPLDKLAALSVNPEKGVNTVEEAWQGAMDIVAETVSDRADVREFLRRLLWQEGQLASELIVDENVGQDFLMYKEYSEPVRFLPPHRILALNRGENLKCLKLTLVADTDKMQVRLHNFLKVKDHGAYTPMYTEAIADAYKRLIFPSLEREIRSELTAKAEKQAISVFSTNLRQLLLQQPIGGHTVLGLDPGYRTGCKAAVVNPQGRVLAIDTLYLTGSEHQQAEAEQKFLKLVKNNNVTLVSMGNGTASYETEEFTAKLIEKYHLNVSYVIASEAGASVYSASKLAREELPDLDVSIRGAVSIARRIQDPLAELVKIEPKAIGVGQYQHDVNQKDLTEALRQVVESCVNHVGVDLNTASPALLSYVSGISSAVAKNIITYRNENGAFKNRKQLLKVPRLGPAAFTQCAGFLRIQNGTEPLDNTSVHPESYKLTASILEKLGCQTKNCAEPSVQVVAAKADPAPLAEALGAGLPTVTDILGALAKPGRDPREDSPAPMSRKKVTKLSDLTIGSVVKGTVQNVVDFGCFVDIGLKVSGLVHRSELSHKHFRHPLDVVSVGQIVDVMIISIDEKRNRIGLSIKQVPKDDKK